MTQEPYKRNSQTGYVTLGLVVRAKPEHLEALVDKIKLQPDVFLVYHRYSEKRLRLLEEG